MVERRGRWFTWAVAAPLCLFTAGCVQDTQPVDTSTVPTGTLWEGDGDESVRLENGGIGSVVAIPYSADATCDPERFRTMSGDIEWEAVDDGELVLRQ